MTERTDANFIAVQCVQTFINVSARRCRCRTRRRRLSEGRQRAMSTNWPHKHVVIWPLTRTKPHHNRTSLSTYSSAYPDSPEAEQGNTSLTFSKLLGTCFCWKLVLCRSGECRLQVQIFIDILAAWKPNNLIQWAKVLNHQTTVQISKKEEKKIRGNEKRR